jgi:GNAT superfamily N-acetyltransferase
MNITITAEHPDTPDATNLVDELDAELEPLYARESRHGYSVARLVAEGVDFFVLRRDGVPAGCGGIKFEPAYAELKRMFVRTQFRGTGLSKRMLEHLTAHALHRGTTLLRLETGIHQHAAIALYERAGFERVRPFGAYREDPVSLCYEKRLERGD